MTKKSTARNAWGRRAVIAAAAVTVLAASACSPGGQTSGNASGGAGAGTSNAKIFVIGGKSDDPFWSKVKRGVDDAAKVVTSEGGSVTFLGPQNYDNLGPDAAKLIDSTLTQGATAVIAPDWVPDAQDAALQRVSDKNIPLFIYNAGGLEAADKVGAINYIGTAEHDAGLAAGTYLGKQGLKNVICVNTLPGVSGPEDRCNGMIEGVKANGGSANQLPLPSSQFGNKTAVAQAIKAAVLNDASIDAVITIGVTDSDSAVSGIQQANLTDKIKLGTFDTDETALKRVKDGTLMFAVDQQPYMQGYLAVSMANAYVRYGMNLPQRPLLTGPALIDAQNVDQALAGAAAGTR
jgi:simple sugar transport system substrate-binding protein